MAIEAPISHDFKSAIEAGKNGGIRSWVIDYLQVEGQNPDLAEGIKYHARYVLGPTGVDLNRLTRIAGPEASMDYKAISSEWEERVGYYATLIKGGWSPPPLIAIDFLPGHTMAIGDGNKRLEALKMAGINKYWTVFCLQRNPLIYNL